MEISNRMRLYPQTKCFSHVALCLATLLALSAPSAAQNTYTVPAADYDQVSSTTSTERSQSQMILDEGAEFENNRQWGEALNAYQLGLKSFPNDEELKQRRAVARIHFDLERRYSDSSFLKTLDTTDGHTALNVYAEVLLKVQSSYVDQPNWADLASYGLTSLEVAMMSPEFREKNIPQASDSQIRSTILNTRKALSQVTVNNRHDAYIVASSTAKALSDSIGLDVQATAYEFVCGAISALDPYSVFMSSNQYSESMSQIEGNYVGLGVELRTHPDHLEIVGVIDGGSASIGGIVEGDHIIGVDRNKVEEIGSERAADLMRGLEGTRIQITLDRGQSPHTVTLERRRIEIPSVDQISIVDRPNGIGYVRLTNFQKNTPEDFEKALWKLHRDGMKSLIVDVRGNPGGLLQASVDIADFFINRGVIVSTRGRNSIENYVHRANVENTWRVPLVVLVDENSASASEIFAAAIRDHGRGLIVGNQSYGKGSVQGIFPLNVSGGGVRLTTAKFYSPRGNPISEIGVKADVLVHEAAKLGNISTGEDNGLRIGIQTARRHLIQREPAATNISRSSRPAPQPRAKVAGR